MDGSIGCNCGSHVFFISLSLNRQSDEITTSVTPPVRPNFGLHDGGFFVIIILRIRRAARGRR